MLLIDAGCEYQFLRQSDITPHFSCWIKVLAGPARTLFGCAGSSVEGDSIQLKPGIRFEEVHAAALADPGRGHEVAPNSSMEPQTDRDIISGGSYRKVFHAWREPLARQWMSHDVGLYRKNGQSREFLRPGDGP